MDSSSSPIHAVRYAEVCNIFGYLKWAMAIFEQPPNSHEAFLSHRVPIVIIHFSRIFHEINHPAIGVPPWLWKPPHSCGNAPFQWANQLSSSLHLQNPTTVVAYVPSLTRVFKSEPGLRTSELLEMVQNAMLVGNYIVRFLSFFFFRMTT